VAPGQQKATAPPSQAALAQAENLLAQGRTQEALSILHDLSSKVPKVPGLETKIGKAHFQKRQFPDAVRHLDAALHEDPNDLEATQLLALSYYGSGQFAQAIPLLEKLGGHLPKESADGPYLLGISYIMTQRWDDARNAFARMFAVASDSAMAHLLLGKILVRQKMEDRALPEVEKALQLDPRLPMAHFLLGEIDLSRRNAEAGVLEFQQELAINPTVWLVYWRLGDAYARLQNYDEAEKNLKEAIWLNESSSGAYIMLGQIYLKKGDANLALGFLERALKLDPQNFYVHFFLGKAYQNLARSDEANHEFEICKSLKNDELQAERAVLQDVQ
jgi:tetratricopeptide (TPR) repeat protein